MNALLLIDSIADGKTLTTLSTTTAKNCTAPTVLHTLTETMLVGALAIVRLECSFHNYTYTFG